eukprot:Gregarina_sp_Pseudo_9__1838@NODE_2253_length_1076_cov_629_771456_g2075_i0_p1_GENE_NODE_2253_length_1076_cov_629_771456_g2075_i0NODE_2253_length_1076_cov_629_771456_g2075_i0_p1_ORF_typecomplete_len301_score76_08_NODE_2253_length_1076_cov_629_771456_g2075_i01741007
MNLRPLSLLLFLSQSLLEADTADNCVAAAIVDSPFVHVSILATDRLLIVKSKAGSGAPAEVVNCTGYDGLNWHALETLEDDLVTTCHGRSVFNPATLDSAKFRASCSPAAFEKSPWACLPGDWSGKFGKLPVLTQATAGRVAAAYLPFFGAKEEVAVSANATYSEAYTPEIVRVFEDPLPIPPCVLATQAVSLYCTDGRIAGCSFFKPLIPPVATGLTRAQIVEAGIRFLLYADRKEMTPTAKPDTDKSWTDKLKSTDYWNHLWDDVKKKSRNFWDL